MSRDRWLRSVAVIALLAVAAGALVACSGQSVAVIERSQPVRTEAKPQVSTGLVWSRVASSLNRPEVDFVVRLTNSSDTTVCGITMTVQALDSSGANVGTAEVAMPDVPAASDFDYFGNIGGTAFSTLSGQPATVTVSDVSPAQTGSVLLPQLKVSEVKLAKANAANLFTKAPYAYDMNARVTNDTGQVLSTQVRQQVIVYDSAGKPVGGGDGSSDNQPRKLAPGSSYREQWDGIPAVRPAASVRYCAWPNR